MGEEAMAAARVAAKKLEVEGMTFAPFVTPQGSSKTHFLAGAGFCFLMGFSVSLC